MTGRSTGWKGILILISLLMIGSVIRPAMGFQASRTPTPDCASALLKIEFVGFEPDGLVHLRVTNNRRIVSVLTDFIIQWRQPAASGLRLAQVTGIAPPDEPESILIWEAADENEDSSPPTRGTEGTWVQNYPVEPMTTTDLYLDFDGTDRALNRLGITAADFNGSFFQLTCGVAGGGGGGGGGGSSVVLSSTDTPTDTPTRPPQLSVTMTASDSIDTTPVMSQTDVVMFTLTAMVVQPRVTPTPTASSSPSHTPLPTASPSPTEVSIEATEESVVTEEVTRSLDQPTELPTETPTPSSTPLVIAEAGIQVRSDVSGEIIGDGTLRLYAPTTARYPQTILVELELNVDNLYITPTPIGAHGTPPPRATSSAVQTTATPRSPILTDSGLPIYQRMGATLLCAIQSFEGCDAQRDLNQAKLVTSRTTLWSWILTPGEAVQGIQDLRIEVWLVQRNLDGNLEYLDLEGGLYRFQIDLNPPAGVSIPLLIGVVAAAVVLGAGLLLARRRKPESTPPLPSADGPKVFISYRRGSSWGQARSIEQSLRQRGANVFIDIDDINEGRFAEIIEKAITECDYFLAVLAPGTLDSEWVRREIRYALAQGKTIIPLLLDNFHLDESQIPPDIKEIASHNAITLLPEFYGEAMDRLAKRFLRLN